MLPCEKVGSLGSPFAQFILIRSAETAPRLSLRVKGARRKIGGHLLINSAGVMIVCFSTMPPNAGTSREWRRVFSSCWKCTIPFAYSHGNVLWVLLLFRTWIYIPRSPCPIFLFQVDILSLRSRTQARGAVVQIYKKLYRVMQH